MGVDKIGFIGAGNMATALAAGMVKAGLKTPAALIAADPDAGRRAAFGETIGAGVTLTADNHEVLRQANTIFLCTKPQVVAAVLPPLAADFTAHHLIISILAGTAAEQLHMLAGGKTPVVRVMPNTPMLIGQGAAAISPGPGATAAHLATARKYLEAAAIVVETTPELMNAVTALSGSGPAYLYYLAEAMIAAGVAMGLSAEDARTLTTRTLTGSAAMIAATGQPPEQLRAQVTSPKGTTEAAVTVLDQKAVKDTLITAILRARDRGVELSQPMKDN